MEKPEQLITAIMGEYAKDLEAANDSLCELIDSLTDENNRPLPHISLPFVEKLKDIAHSLYEMHDIRIHEDVEDMVATMKHFYKPKM